MRFILGVILIVILSIAAEWLLPWWSMALVCFGISLLMGFRSGRSFLLGFLGAGLCWLIVALWHDIPNDHILSTRMAALFHLPSYVWFVAVTALVGGLVGGLAAWSGGLIVARRQT